MKYILGTLALAFSVVLPASASVYVNTSATEKNCAATQSQSTQFLNGYFEASSFSIGGAQPAGSTGTKPTLQNLMIAKPFDNCSGTLITQFITGAIIPTVTLIEVTTGGLGVPQTFLTITLKNATISNYLVTDSSNTIGGENISFQFQSACIVATNYLVPSNPTSTSVCYDAPSNSVTK